VSRRHTVLIAGLGVTGLAAAYELRNTRPELSLIGLDPRSGWGGNIQTEREHGFLIDAGPDSFLRTKPEAARLCAALGLHHELIAPADAAREVGVVYRGRIRALPGGMVLGIPTRLAPLIDTPLVSPLGKLRALAELAERRGRTPREDETVASFFVRHFGREVTYRVAGPLLGGIFAGDIEELSIRATFPQLLAMEERHGSLIAAVFALERERSRAAEPKAVRAGLARVFGWMRREPSPGPSPFLTLRSGLHTLVQALGAAARFDTLRFGESLVQCQPDGAGGYLATLGSGEVLRVDGIIGALPAHAAARIVPDPRLAEELAAIEYGSTATVFLSFPRALLPEAALSSGFVVPKSEGSLLACTYVSTKWQGRAPDDLILLRVFLGGARAPSLIETTSDPDLVMLAEAELARLLGRPLSPQFSRVYRWPKANAQPKVGHLARLERILGRLAQLPGLRLVGAGYGSIGISDCAAAGRSAAQGLLATLEGRSSVLSSMV
jgi:protoporphyrinogen/coproporphyrinogen III oxidase